MTAEDPPTIVMEEEEETETTGIEIIEIIETREIETEIEETKETTIVIREIGKEIGGIGVHTAATAEVERQVP